MTVICTSLLEFRLKAFSHQPRRIRSLLSLKLLLLSTILNLRQSMAAVETYRWIRPRHHQRGEETGRSRADIATESTYMQKR
jgi:hypothetical protein